MTGPATAEKKPSTATIVKRDGELWVQIPVAEVRDGNGRLLAKPTIGQLAELFQLHPTVVLNSVMADATVLKFLFQQYVKKPFPKSEREARRILFAASTTTAPTPTGAKVARPFYDWALDPAQVKVVLLPRNGTTLLAVQQQESIRVRVAKVRDGPGKTLERLLAQIESAIETLDGAALALHKSMGSPYKRIRKGEKEPDKNAVDPGTGVDALSPLMDLDRIDVVLNLMAKAAANDPKKKGQLEKIKKLKRLPGEPERAGRIFDDFKKEAQRLYLKEPFYAASLSLAFKTDANVLRALVESNEFLTALEQLALVTFNMKGGTTVSGFLVKETKDDLTVAKSVTDGTETTVKRKDVLEQLGPDWDLLPFALQDRIDDTLRLAYQALLASGLDQAIVEKHVLPMIQKLARMQAPLDVVAKNNQALADALKNPPAYPTERNALTILAHLFGFTRSGPGPQTLVISVLQYSAPFLARWATQYAANGQGGPSKMSAWLMKVLTRTVGLNKKQQQALVDSIEQKDLTPIMGAAVEDAVATSYQAFVDLIMKGAPRDPKFRPAVYIPDTRMSSTTGVQLKSADTMRGSGYHGGDSHPDDVVAGGGLAEKGTNWYLLEHAIPDRGTPHGQTAFRGSTTVLSIPETGQGAAYWGEYVYEFDGMPSWNVNAALQGRVRSADGVHWDDHPYRGEGENAVPARIPIERIKRWGKVVVTKTVENQQSKTVTEWTTNPAYKPLPDDLPPLKAPGSAEPPPVLPAPKAGAPPIADRWWLKAMNHWSFQALSGILCLVALVGSIEETGDNPLVHWSKILGSGTGALVGLGSAVNQLVVMAKAGNVPSSLAAGAEAGAAGASKFLSSLALVGAIAGIVVSIAQFKEARESRDTMGQVLAGIGVVGGLASAAGFTITLLVVAGWLGGAGVGTSWAGVGEILIVIGLVLAVVALLIGLVSWIFGSKKEASEKVVIGLMDSFKAHKLYGLAKDADLGLDDKWGDAKDALKDLDYWDLPFDAYLPLFFWGFDTETISAMLPLDEDTFGPEYIWSCIAVYNNGEYFEALEERQDPNEDEQDYWYRRRIGFYGGMVGDPAKDDPKLHPMDGTYPDPD